VPNSDLKRRAADVFDAGVGKRVEENESEAPEIGEKKRRTGGVGSGSRKNHKREGNLKRRTERLAAKLKEEGETVKSDLSSIVEDGSAASTGWHGIAPSLNDRQIINKGLRQQHTTESLEKIPSHKIQRVGHFQWRFFTI